MNNELSLIHASYFLILLSFGLIIGSFLNVLILRYNPSGQFFNFKKLSGRSHCLNCRKNLRWFELIPVLSFVLQLGKCRRCKNRISFQYPAVEILSGLIFLIIPSYLSNLYRFDLFNLSLPQLLFISFWILVFLILLLITFIDFREYVIPDELNLGILFSGIGIIVISQYFSGSFFAFFDSFLKNFSLFFPFQDVWVNHLLGGALGFIFFFTIFYLSRGRGMGFGDVKLATASGILLGLPDIIMAISLSFIVGGIVGLFLMIFKGKSRKDRVPFGPFFVLGIILTFFFGHDILNLYFAAF